MREWYEPWKYKRVMFILLPVLAWFGYHKFLPDLNYELYKQVNAQVEEIKDSIKKTVCLDGSCFNFSFLPGQSSGKWSKMVVQAKQLREVSPAEIIISLDEDEYKYTIGKFLFFTETSSYYIKNPVIRAKFIFDFENVKSDKDGLVPTFKVEIARTSGEDSTIGFDSALNRIKSRMPGLIFKQALLSCPDVFRQAKQYSIGKQDWGAGLAFQISPSAINLNNGWPTTILLKDKISEDVGNISSSDNRTFGQFMLIGDEHPAPKFDGRIRCQIKTH